MIVLPWFEVGGEEVKLSDMRRAFTLAETDPESLLPDSGSETPPLDPTTSIPSPDEISDAIETEVRATAAQAAADAIDSGRSRYLELYTDIIWMVVAGAWGWPRSWEPLLGLRGLAGSLVLLAAGAHGAALWVVFSGSGRPARGSGCGWASAAWPACSSGPSSGPSGADPPPQPAAVRSRPRTGGGRLRSQPCAVPAGVAPSRRRRRRHGRRRLLAARVRGARAPLEQGETIFSLWQGFFVAAMVVGLIV